MESLRIIIIISMAGLLSSTTFFVMNIIALRLHNEMNISSDSPEGAVVVNQTESIIVSIKGYIRSAYSKDLISLTVMESVNTFIDMTLRTVSCLLTTSVVLATVYVLKDVMLLVGALRSYSKLILCWIILTAVLATVHFIVSSMGSMYMVIAWENRLYLISLIGGNIVGAVSLLAWTYVVQYYQEQCDEM